jgi:hypothetical protein
VFYLKTLQVADWPGDPWCVVSCIWPAVVVARTGGDKDRSVQALPGGTGSGEVPNFYFLFLLPVPDENAVAQRFAVLVLRRLTQRWLLSLSVSASKGWRPDPGAERMLESHSLC